jgi:N-ethylmaleimide reductase
MPRGDLSWRVRSAGLIVAEATMAMEGHSAFWREPGLYSPAQIEGWRLTTEAVHRAGGTQSHRHHW